MKHAPNFFFRILIVEDDPDRIEILKTWLPDDVMTVAVTSSGKAIGLLERDCGRVYAGIMLDHDLQEQVAAESDRYLCGQDVVDAITRNIQKDVPILIHSMNLSESPAMVRRLEGSGFQVTRIPFANLSRENLTDWMEDARELWEDWQD